MTVIADYTPEEQSLLAQGPRAAALVVSTASLESGAETASEGFAAASYVLGSQGKYLDNTLISSIIYALEKRAEAEQPFANYNDLAEAPGAHEKALEQLRQVSALLAKKSNADEAAGYKDWCLNTAAVTTEAGKEDPGFLGWGSVWVNDEERAAMQEVAAALGVEYTPPAK